MKPEYSFTKGLAKGLVSVLVIGSGMVAFAGFSDMTIWSLVEQYLKPVIGSLTVGGVLTIAINFIKFNFLS